MSATTNDQPLNEQLKALRELHNLSQTAVAKALGVTRQAVTRWEAGDNYPTRANVIALADLFQLEGSDRIGLYEATGA